MSDATFLESVSQDLLYALRTMRKAPAFAAVAVLTLALGIGANTASFSVIRAVLLKPLAYRNPEGLVNISGGATPVRFTEMRSTAQSFTEIGAFTAQQDLTLTGGAQPEVLKASRVSATFLRILGVVPVLGRGFLATEDSPGGPATAMIGAELWQHRFSGDLHIVGQPINLGGVPHTIVGVLPARFQFPFPGLDVWLTQPEECPSADSKSCSLSPVLNIFGRLKPGITMERASAEAALIHHQYAINHPAMLDAKPKSPVRVEPLKEELVRDIRSELWMMFGAVGFVLLITCANIASLLLARAHARSHEFALRSALGAARGRLIRQLLAESVLLSSFGGLFGMLFAFWSLHAIRHLKAFDLPRADEIHLDGAVLAFAAVLSLLTGILFGLAPSLAASRPDLMGVLRGRTENFRKGTSGNSRLGFGLRGTLVVAQIALSIVLLIGAALLIESVLHLRGANPGFDPANLLTMRISLPPQRYDTDQKKDAFFTELIRRIELQPGVRCAAAAMTLPMTGYAGTPVQDASKPPLRLNERPIATILIVTPHYLSTLKIPLRRGRTFTERDRQNAGRVAMIDEGLARQLWPAYPGGLDPVGQHLFVGGTNPHPAEIIGVVANVHQTIDNSAWPGSVYVMFAQNPLPSALLAIRTESDPTGLTSAVRAQVQALDREQPVSDVQSMTNLVDAQLGPRQLLVALLGSFAGVALVLALVGVYGVIAYSVTERTQELGVRRALGATEGDILRLILGQALGFALAGAVIGVFGALALTRVVKTLLFQISATDPATFATVALLFVIIAITASYFPARRAVRIDPMQALRYE